MDENPYETTTDVEWDRLDRGRYAPLVDIDLTAWTTDDDLIDLVSRLDHAYSAEPYADDNEALYAAVWTLRATMRRACLHAEAAERAAEDLFFDRGLRAMVDADTTDEEFDRWATAAESEAGITTRVPGLRDQLRGRRDELRAGHG